MRDTPITYLESAPKGKNLTDKMKVWRIQDTNDNIGKAGAVSWEIKADYPDEAETIVLGFAPGKPYYAVGIGRHGNFLQWGWSAAPSKMTEAGRNLFLNCICHIHKYNNKEFVKIPINIKVSRNYVFIWFNFLINEPENIDNVLSRFFPQEIVDKYKTNIEDLQKYYEENVELIYLEKDRYYIDEDLKSLGLSSNRKVDTIEKLIELLSDQSQAELAGQLLVKYTQENFDTPGQWKKWYEDNSKYLYFSDTGGYKFYVVKNK